MIKILCSKCGKEIKKSTDNILNSISDNLEDYGFLTGEVKRELGSALNLSVRQLEKYIKVLAKNDNDVFQAKLFIETEGSLNKAYNKTINKTIDFELNLYKQLIKKDKYQDLKYKDFKKFLDSGGVYNG